MRTYLYDGSFEGFLTAAALALENGGDCLIERNGAAEPELFRELINSGTDPEKAASVRALAGTRGSPESWKHIRFAFLSGLPGAETAILAYLRLLAEKGSAAENMLADSRVSKLLALSGKTAGEAHRFKGFVRFGELADGSLYAKIEPDHDILDLIIPHFRARLAAFNWVIHDAARGKAALYFRGNLVRAPLVAVRELPAAAEEDIRTLWRSFFRIAAIKERANPGLQRKNVPFRYRRNLTEFPALRVEEPALCAPVPRRCMPRAAHLELCEREKLN